MAKTLFSCAMTLCASTLLLNAQDIQVTQLKPDTAPKESAITFGSPDVAVPETPSASSTVPVDPPVYGMKWVCTKAFPKKKFHVYDCNDEGVIYQNEANANNCFFVKTGGMSLGTFFSMLRLSRRAASSRRLPMSARRDR